MVVGIAVVGSRMMGLVREVIFAHMFGAGAISDAYTAAFRIPNLLRDLFAEGALSTAFTTTFAKMWQKEGPAAAWRLGELVISSLMIVISVVSMLGVITAPWLVTVTSHGFEQVPGKFDLAVNLTRILFPFIIFVSLAAVVMGMLNARNVFGIPASASTAFNIISVISGVLLALVMEPQKDWHHPHFGVLSIYGWCFGVLIGGLAQLFLQIPALWKLGFRFGWRMDWKDPGLRTVLVLMLPSALAGSAVQINVMVNGAFAANIDGASSWLYYAFRLVQLPIGVFGVAIATVTLPAVARLHAMEDLKAFGKTVEEALRFGFYLTLPSSIGLAVMARPLIEVIYQRGAFDAHATAETALALQAYAIGLAGYSGIKILVPCFYALNETRIPPRVSFIGIGLNLALAALFFFWFKLGHMGLALTTGLVAIINFLQLLWAMSGRVDLGSPLRWTDFFTKVSFAGFACGAVAFAGTTFLFDPLHQTVYGKFVVVRATVMLAVIAVAALVYLVLTMVMKVPEGTEVLNLVKRKLNR